MPSQADRPTKTQKNCELCLALVGLALWLYAVANSVEVQPTKCVHVATRLEKVTILGESGVRCIFFRMVSNLFMIVQCSTFQSL